MEELKKQNLFKVSSGRNRSQIKREYVDYSKSTNTQTLTGHSDSVNSLLKITDDGLFASGSFDSSIKLWKLINDQYKPYQTLTGHTNSVYSLIKLSDDGLIASGSSDKSIKIWKKKGNQFELV